MTLSALKGSSRQSQRNLGPTGQVTRSARPIKVARTQPKPHLRSPLLDLDAKDLKTVVKHLGVTIVNLDRHGIKQVGRPSKEAVVTQILERGDQLVVGIPTRLLLSLGRLLGDPIKVDGRWSLKRRRTEVVRQFLEAIAPRPVQT